jgi:hypothetical protein
MYESMNLPGGSGGLERQAQHIQNKSDHMVGYNTPQRRQLKLNQANDCPSTASKTL